MRTLLQRFWTWRSLALLAFFGFVLTAVTGCADAIKASKGTASGKITYKGAAVTGGRINFWAGGKDGVSYGGPIANDGTYKVEGIPPGSAQVTVETDSAKSAANPYGSVKPPRGVTMPPPPQVSPVNAPVYVKIPEKYKDPEKSGLTLEVTKGSQSKNWELTD
jgi:hypothetical protein